MEEATWKLVTESGLGAAALLIAWRIAERVGQVAEIIAGCQAKMDTLIQLLRRD